MRTPQVVNEVEEEAIALLHAVEERRRERPIEFYQPSAKQLLFHKAPQRKRFFGGANRLGKTTAGTIEVEWYALGTHPYRKIETPNIGWVVTLDSKVSMQVNLPKMKEWFSKGLCTMNEREGIITWKNGSQTYIKSCDSGEEKFQGAGLRYVWFDEEPPEKIYRESMARVSAGTRLDVWMTATLLNGLTYVYEEFLAPAQDALDHGRVDPDIFAVVGSIADNPNFSAQEIRDFASSFRGDEYRVRVEGAILQMGVDSVIGMELLDVHRKTVRPPDFTGTFFGEKGSVKFQQRADGDVLLWGEKDRPPSWEKYSIGWDVSEGRGGDYSVARCLNVRTREEVCVIRSRKLSPKEMGLLVARMSWWYNNALVCPESNAIGLAAVDALRELNVRLYMKTYLDRLTQTWSEKVGFKTTTATRPYLIEQYISQLPDMVTHDAVLVEEMGHFVRLPDGKMAARRGKHDDSLFASMLAVECANQVPTPRQPKMTKKTDFEKMLQRKRKEAQVPVASLGGY